MTGRIQQDLTQDMWAGQPVMVHLAARDDAGAMALSAAAQVRLPQRPFSSPVARQLIALRRQLLAGSMEPLTAALALTRMSSRPGPLRDDLTVYLGLRAAIHRLTNGSYRGGPEDAAGMLWQVALDLESQKTATVRRN